MGSNQQNNGSKHIESNNYLWSIFIITRNLDQLAIKVEGLRASPAQESLISAINKHYDKISEACKENLSTCKINAQYDLDEMTDDYPPVSTQSVFNSGGDLIGTIYTSIDGLLSYSEIGEIPEFVQVEDQD